MKKRWGSKIMSGPGDTRGRGVLGHDRVPRTLAVVLYLKKKYCFIPIPWLPTVLIIPLQQWLLMQLLLLIPLLQLDAHFYYHYYYRSRCYGMTGVSPHSDTFFLHQLPDPGWSPGRQATLGQAGKATGPPTKILELAAGMVVWSAWRKTIKQLRLIHYRIRDSSRASRGPPPTWLDESERLQASAIDI